MIPSNDARVNLYQMLTAGFVALQVRVAVPCCLARHGVLSPLLTPFFSVVLGSAARPGPRGGAHLLSLEGQRGRRRAPPRGHDLENARQRSVRFHATPPTHSGPRPPFPPSRVPPRAPPVLIRILRRTRFSRQRTLAELHAHALLVERVNACQVQVAAAASATEATAGSSTDPSASRKRRRTSVNEDMLGAATVVLRRGSITHLGTTMTLLDEQQVRSCGPQTRAIRVRKADMGCA